MTRWHVISFTIFLTIITSTIGFFGLQEEQLDGLLNLLKFKIGGLKFLKQLGQYQNNELPDTTPNYGATYDFIIIGAGSAGATIASRLSEIDCAKVLLIEAGGHENLFMDVPLLALFLQFNEEADWGYYTEPSNDYCLGLQNNQCKVARGKVVGGTSVINFMIATKGTKNDYDEWAEVTGDNNWSYEGMLESFKKLENFDDTFTYADKEYRGFNGPMNIVNPKYRTPLATAFVKAGEELGFPLVDYNARRQTGFSYIQANLRNGERLSSNRAYLYRAKNRRNLHLSLNSFVTKILIDPKSKIAYGVEFIKFNKKYRVIARKEVILSAGAINSPQLLMLSGIGPAEHLRSHNIEVLVDSPVGENMMDHVAYGGLTFLVNETVSMIVGQYLNPANPTISEYLTQRSGPLATAGGIEALGYVNVDDPRAENEDPNIELMFGGISLLSDYLIHMPFKLKENHWQLMAPYLYRHAWLIWPLLMKPKSRGKILLRSKSPFAKPKLLANYFTHPDDVRVAVKGIRMAIEVSKTKAMQRYDSELFDYTVPGCETHEPDSDSYWECALRTYTMTLWHHSGTCKMGKESDKSTVVNSKLQVKGIKRLRVADASIMPNIVTAHTNIPTIAIAEKFSDILKADWGYFQNYTEESYRHY